MDFMDCGEMLLKVAFKGGWEHGDAVFGSLAVVDDDLIPEQVDVLDPQAEAFLQAHAGAV